MDPELVGPFLKQPPGFAWSLRIFLDTSVEVGDSEYPQKTMVTKPFRFESKSSCVDRTAAGDMGCRMCV